MKILSVVGAFVLGVGLFALLFSSQTIPVVKQQVAQVSGMATDTVSLPVPPEAAPPAVVAPVPVSATDIAPQPQLQNPPAVVKAIYMTGWTAGSPNRVAALINMIKRTELNAVVIDIKDYSGYVSYAMQVPEVQASGAEKELRIANPNRLIKELHDNGIYAIARVTVFQDRILAKAHPEWALGNKITGKTWADRSGLAWMDPGGQGTWEYVVGIAKDALSRGFDEVNFDYVRFASDGVLGTIQYPFWDMKTPRHVVIGRFFKYLREQMGTARISADLFGLATVNHDDLGIGQVIEDAYKYFDYVSPMVYPSHYATGFLGYKNPGAYPYEVMKYSLDRARERWDALVRGTTSTPGIAPEHLAQLRPWIQDFNLGAVYDAPMVKKEFQAVYDALRDATSSGAYSGWLVWDPTNRYTEAALAPKS